MSKYKLIIQKYEDNKLKRGYTKIDEGLQYKIISKKKEIPEGIVTQAISWIKALQYYPNEKDLISKGKKLEIILKD